MFDLSAVLGVTGPVFFIMLLGYAAVKYGWVPANSTQAFSAFAVKFALPALLFKSISEMKVSEFFDGRYLTGYAVGSLLAFGGLFAVCVFLRRKNLSHSAMFAMGGSFSNNLMIGYPIVIQLFGAAAMTPLALTLMVENFIMFPLALILADIGRGIDLTPSRCLWPASRRCLRTRLSSAFCLVCCVPISVSSCCRK